MILYEILTDRLPFGGASAFEVLMNASTQELPPPSRVAAGGAIDPTLERICLDALARNREERIPTADALADRLVRWVAEGSPAPRRRRRPAVAAVAVAAAAAILFAVTRPPAVERPPRLTARPDLVGHSKTPNSLAFSRDGRLLLSGGADAQLRLWRLPMGGESESIGLHEGKVEAVAWSPDGKLILTATELEDRGDEPGEIALWDAATGAPVRRFTGHGGGLNGAAISPDGRTIAAACQDGRLWLWDAATGEIAGSLEGHRAQVRAVAFLADGTRLVSASFDNDARLWDVKERRTLRTFSGHDKGIWGLGLSRDHRTLATEAGR